MDKTIAEISRFHFVLAGNPFDLSLAMATPLSDPAVSAAAKGKIDLGKLQQAIPLDSITLNGLLDISLDLAGRMSMIENKEYEKFRAVGDLKIADMAVEMSGMPDMRISSAAFALPGICGNDRHEGLNGQGQRFFPVGQAGELYPIPLLGRNSPGKPVA